MAPGMTERRNSRSRDLQSPFSCDPLPPAQPHLLRAYRSPNSACHQRRNKPLKHEPVGGISDSNHKKVPPLEILQDYSAWGGGFVPSTELPPHMYTQVNAPRPSTQAFHVPILSSSGENSQICGRAKPGSGDCMVQIFSP